ncbi:MAG TPA: iron ABC transporter permease [Kouleothrix sp.]|uniref:ABC transporter permease n=1 Tax=Kouleothrix sp. TaxID=2779161 RepID=UPI002B7F02B0|nr:iron ABC transporter permease [Kouleothrix sp.]
MRYRTLIYALPLLFLALFFFYPLAAILRLSFGGDARLAPADGGLARLLADSYYFEVIWFSTWQALLSTALTLLVALPATYAFARYRFAGKALLRALATVPFVLPTVVVAAAFKALIGPRDLLNTALQSWLGLAEPPIRLDQTLALILIAHVFYNYSVVLRIVGAFWGALDSRLEQAAAVLGASRLRAFREVTLPLLLPAIGAAALLIFVYTFASFGVIRILGGPRFATVEVEIYRLTTSLLRLDLAAALALVQMAATLLTTLAYTWLQRRASVPLDMRARAASARPLVTWRQRVFVAANLAALLALIGAPLLALALRSVTAISPGGASQLTLGYYLRLNTNPARGAFALPPLIAIGNSLRFALAATALALLVGVPGAYLLAERTKYQEPRSRGGAGRFAFLGSRLSALLDPIFMLPLGASAVTLGLGYILVFGRPPLNLLASPWLIPVAHALLAFPFVVRALLPTLRGLDPRLREAASVLGAGPLRVLREVDLPLLLPALLAGAAFAFTVSIGEFGAALLLARPENQTVPVVIDRLLGLPGAENYGRALALSTILMLTTGLSFVLLERVRVGEAGEF